MPGFEPHSLSKPEPENVATSARNARYGLVLFAIYFVVYAGFVLVNAFRPDWMEWTPAAGVNLAIWYGFALILGALVISLAYGWLVQSDVAETASREKPRDL